MAFSKGLNIQSDIKVLKEFKEKEEREKSPFWRHLWNYADGDHMSVVIVSTQHTDPLFRLLESFQIDKTEGKANCLYRQYLMNWILE